MLEFQVVIREHPPHDKDGIRQAGGQMDQHHAGEGCRDPQLQHPQMQPHGHAQTRYEDRQHQDHRQQVLAPEVIEPQGASGRNPAGDRQDGRGRRHQHALNQGVRQLSPGRAEHIRPGSQPPLLGEQLREIPAVAEGPEHERTEGQQHGCGHHAAEDPPFHSRAPRRRAAWVRPWARATAAVTTAAITNPAAIPSGRDRRSTSL